MPLRSRHPGVSSRYLPWRAWRHHRDVVAAPAAAVAGAQRAIEHDGLVAVRIDIHELHHEVRVWPVGRGPELHAHRPGDGDVAIQHRGLEAKVVVPFADWP